jgi:dTMP kinase
LSAFFIALEGIDGSGTTTQTALLCDWLRAGGIRVHRTGEPSRGPLGQVLRALLHGQLRAEPDVVALLFAADRLDHLAREIEPQLRDGACVVSDRYVLSSLAYQSVDSPPAWVSAINSRARPADACFLLAVRPEVAAARRTAQRRLDELFDAPPTQQRVADGYGELARRHGAVVLDGERPIDEVQADLRSHLARILRIE